MKLSQTDDGLRISVCIQQVKAHEEQKLNSQTTMDIVLSQKTLDKLWYMIFT